MSFLWSFGSCQFKVRKAKSWMRRFYTYRYPCINIHPLPSIAPSPGISNKVWGDEEQDDCPAEYIECEHDKSILLRPFWNGLCRRGWSLIGGWSRLLALHSWHYGFRGGVFWMCASTVAGWQTWNVYFQKATLKVAFRYSARWPIDSETFLFPTSELRDATSRTSTCSVISSNY
jgi:hypothetical protein